MAGELATRCPECESVLKLKNDSTLGKKVRCPKCSQPFVVKAMPQQQAVDDFDDFDDGPAKPRATRKRTSAKKSGRKKSKSKSGQWPMPALLAGGGGLVVLLVVVAVLMLNRGGDEPAPNAVAQNDAAAATSDAGGAQAGGAQAGGAQNGDAGNAANPAGDALGQNPNANAPAMPAADVRRAFPLAPPVPQNNTPPAPIEITISNPKIVRQNHGMFAVELPFSTVGEMNVLQSQSKVEVRVRPLPDGTWEPAVVNFDPTVIGQPEGTIRTQVNVVRQGEKHFLDDLKAGVEFEFKVTYLERGTVSTSNVLQTSEYEIVEVEPMSIREVVATFGNKGEKEFGDIVMIADVPTYTSIDNNGMGYVIFRYNGLPTVDCFFSGPGGVQRSDSGKTVTVHGMIGMVRPDRIAILGAYYAKPPE